MTLSQSQSHTYSSLSPPAHRRFGSIPRIVRHLIVFFTLTFALLGFSAYTNLADQEEGSMRLCLPLDLTRISNTGHRAFSCIRTNGTMRVTEGVGQQGVNMGRLGEILLQQKLEFLDDLRRGKRENWVMVMGNEAGDLDSLASSIAYSTLSSQLTPNNKSVPLILTPSTLLDLRPENKLALALADVPDEALLHTDHLPLPTSELSGLGVKFALVDHNSLLPQFYPASKNGSTEQEDPVVAIIDHHADDQKHPAASPRVIRIPTGSSSSLVTMQFAPQWQASPDLVPSELATLLLTAGVIDTGGYKPGEASKTQEVDRQAAEFLWSLSGPTITAVFSPTSNGSAAAQSVPTVTVSQLDQGSSPEPLQRLTQELIKAKYDISTMSSRNLLIRDYKEYSLPTMNSTKEVKLGLATVPLGLGDWLSRPVESDEQGGWAGILAAIEGWMTERGLDILGVLTTFRTNPEDGSRGKSRREILLIARTAPSSQLSPKESEGLFNTLSERMQASREVLDLKAWPGKKAGERLGEGLLDLTEVRRGETWWGDVWRQGNTESTRKQVQPLMKDIIGGCGSS